jgi:hypothetical protein
MSFFKKEMKHQIVLKNGFEIIENGFLVFSNGLMSLQGKPIFTFPIKNILYIKSEAIL